VKSEDTPGLGKVVHRDDGTFKLSEDDLAIGNDDANTSSRMLCQCIRVYCSPSDSSISSTDTAEPVEQRLLHTSYLLTPWSRVLLEKLTSKITYIYQPHFPKTEMIIRAECGDKNLSSE
jgi:hypothetical protein